jgi:two-component system, cell cycle sensor histidine kinase and response regulator CckA
MNTELNQAGDNGSNFFQILLVEDEDGLRRLIKKQLERRKFKVEVAGTGTEVIGRSAIHPDTILLLDYSLPDMTGREVIESLYAAGHNIPFVIITGQGDERIAVDMMKLGARDYLVKDPSLFEVLPRTMEQVAAQLSTERKLSQIKKAWQESEERFRMLFNSGTDAIFVQDIIQGKPGHFIEVNDIACQRLGYQREELLRLSMKQIENPSETNVTSREALLFPGEVPLKKSHTLYEAIQVTKHGEQISVENNSHLIDLGGKPALLCISRDISQRKQLEEQLRQAQKMEAIGRLAGGVAHDFNNLLTAIMGFSELMLVKMEPDNPFREGVHEINRAGKRAAALTRQLLAFSRKQVLKPKILNLNQVVKSMEKMLKRIIGEDIHLHTQQDLQLDKIKADTGQVEQIILNLAVNAADAMPQGGTLTIKTENTIIDKQSFPGTSPSHSRPGRFVCLSIRDTGEGIDKHIIPQIFEPFFTTKDNGTGLGLSVVYGIVKQHNGWIDITSQNNEGSAFHVYFPALSVGKEDVTEQEISLPDFGGHGERILLIEDEAGVRQISARALREYGYHVTEAVTAKEAREIFRQEKGNFHLVVIDIVLRDQSGIDLIDDIRLIQPGIKILLTSGYADQRPQWKNIMKKGLPCLHKPYSLSDLLKTVKGLMDADTDITSKVKGEQPV